MERKALISNIQKFCTYDGPGIRSVVFFMGCPLRCKWCQNPENFIGKTLLMFDYSKCTSCGACMVHCKHQVNTLDEKGHLLFDRSRCKACGECIEDCYYEARSLCGSEIAVEEVYSEVMKDEVFFRNTGGGITLSGGECTLFPDFVSELLNKFNKAGIHTAIETSGFCSKQSIEKIVDNVDLFLFDFKLFTSDLHEKWTGKPNDMIKRNLEYLAAEGKQIVIRIPLIAGINDGEEFEKIIHYLKKIPQLKEIHIMPFHQIGASKYGLSGTPYDMAEWKECTQEQASKCQKIAENSGFLVNIGGWDLHCI